MKFARGFGLLIASFFLNACKVDSKVTVTYEGKGVITDGGQIDCPKQCNAEYTHSVLFSRSVRLRAEPAPGYEFVGWMNCGADDFCEHELKAVCLSTISPCPDWQPDQDSAHAIFVPKGSVVGWRQEN